MTRLDGSVATAINGCVVAVPFDHRGEALSVDIVVDRCGVQRVVERRNLVKRDPGRLDLYPCSTPSWSQVEWNPCAHMVSGAVTDLWSMVFCNGYPEFYRSGRYFSRA